MFFKYSHPCREDPSICHDYQTHRITQSSVIRIRSKPHHFDSVFDLLSVYLHSIGMISSVHRYQNARYHPIGLHKLQISSTKVFIFPSILFYDKDMPSKVFPLWTELLFEVLSYGYSHIVKRGSHYMAQEAVIPMREQLQVRECRHQMEWDNSLHLSFPLDLDNRWPFMGVYSKSHSEWSSQWNTYYCYCNNTDIKLVLWRPPNVKSNVTPLSYNTFIGSGC